ncbi:response regulator transcription factor [Sphingobium yanoikuyae]|uniref:response regulator transcription factor n=1 Tax=Sphingobium yanoikuyae TaxID=13690 RepID=UPI00242048D8|nr:response regulator [Sphingobium yanoikuyae]
MIAEPASSAEPERPRVLLVEDDSAVRRSIQLILQARGYDVRAFSSGALALADPSALEAACLVTDYRMAGMSGLDLLRGLRAVGWRRPAILITAHRSDYIEDSEGALFDEILEKPLLDRRLCACVDRATGRA